MSAISLPAGLALPSWRPRRWVIISLLAAAFAIAGGVAYAFWTVGVNANAAGGASSGSLSNPATANAVANNDGSVTISWTTPGTQLSGAHYQVTRTIPGPATVVCPNVDPGTALSCSDTGLAPGTAATYNVHSILGTNWQSTGITASATTGTPKFTIALGGTQPYPAGSPVSITSITAQIAGVTDTAYTGTKTIDWSGLTNSPAPSSQAPTYPSATVTFTNGVASSLSFTPFAAGGSTLTATDHNATAITGFTTFNVGNGPASQIVMSGSNADLPSGTTRSVTATIEDAWNNTVTNGADATRSVTFSKTGGTGTVTGLSSVAAVGGVASDTVTGALAGPVSIGGQATLTSGLTNSANAVSFNVVFGAANQIVMSGSTADLPSGTTRVITATIKDAAGNTVTSGTDSTASVTFSKTAGGGTVTGLTSSPAINGVATDTVTGALAGSVSIGGSATLNALPVTSGNQVTFNVVAGTATKIVMSGTSTNLQSGTTRVITATIEDAAGNTVTTGADSTATVNFSQSGTGTVTGTGTSAAVGGVATKTVTGALIGSVSINGAATLNAVPVTSGNSVSFNVVAGTATQIVMSGTTTNLPSGTTRTITATIEDAAGNTVTTGADSTASVTFSKTAGGGTVTGLTSSPAVAGVATDTVTGALAGSVSIGGSATLNTVPVTSGNQVTFNVVAGTATQIVMSGTTTNLPSGSTRVITATIEDAAGNTVTTGADSTASVTFSKTGGAGTVTGLASSPAVNGVATDTVTGALAGSVSIGGSATLNAVPVTSGNVVTFSVVPGAASQLVFTTQPSGAVANTAFTTQPVVTVEDAAGNAITGDASTVTLSITTGTGTTGATLSGCSQTESNGAITFSGCKIDLVGNGYQLHATDGTLTATDSSAFNVAVGNHLILVNCVVQGASQACNGTYALGNSGTMSASVQLVDASGNPVTPTSPVNMTVSSGNTTTYSVTAGATLTITGTGSPANQSSTPFTIKKNSNASNSTTITIHVTSGQNIPDLTFTVQK